MKYSVSVKFLWPGLSLPDRARKAAEHGFDQVDMWDWRGEDMDGLADACRESGVAIGGFFGHSSGALINPVDRSQILDQVAEAVEVARRVGANQLAMFANGRRPEGGFHPVPPLSPAAMFESTITGLREAVRLVEGTDIKLIVEAINSWFVPGYFWVDSSDTVTICRVVDHPQVQMAFDCFHQQLTTGRLTESMIEALPYSARVDIGDVPGRGEPGTGEINFQHLKRVLEEHRYEGYLTMEVTPPGPTIAESDHSMAVCREVFGF